MKIKIIKLHKRHESHLHDGSGDGGRLAQEVVDAERGEELLVLLRGGALVLADEVGRHLKAGR